MDTNQHQCLSIEARTHLEQTNTILVVSRCHHSKAPSMLQKISSGLAFCLHKASEARKCAAAATDSATRDDLLNLEKDWLFLGRSEEFVDRLEQFCVNQGGPAAPSARPVPCRTAADIDYLAKAHEQVVIVEDAQYSRDGLHDLVESCGYKCEAFGSAEDYLRSHLYEATACLVLDVHLPGMSGPDLQAYLIAEGYCIPIVFVTGQIEEQVRRRVLAAGAVGYLIKPLHDNTLIDYIETALSTGR
jgi:CheY-like chemotaxis protein